MTEHVAPALPVAVRVEPDTVHAPVVVNVRAPPVVPPVAVNANVEPNVMDVDDVIVTAACSAPVIVPQRIPMRSKMLPTLATKPTVTIPVGH